MKYVQLKILKGQRPTYLKLLRKIYIVRKRIDFHERRIYWNSIVICIICVFASFAGFSCYCIFAAVYSRIRGTLHSLLVAKKNYELFLSQVFGIMCLIPGLCFFGFHSTGIWLFLLPALFFLIPAYLSIKKALEESLQSKVATKRA